MPVELFPFQSAYVQAYQQSAYPRRHWCLFDVGLGKSLTALEISKNYTRTLIVAPGSVRGGWLDRWTEFRPDASIAAITQGKERKGLSKPAQARLAAAHACPNKIVSYDLLSELLDYEFDFLIFDEFHSVVSWRSQVRATIECLLARNPQADLLALSATPMAAEPLDTWTWLKLFWPERWGKPSASGDPPFRFRTRYAEAIPNQYADSGFSFKGINKEFRDEFAQVIADVSTRVLREEVANLLPPIDYQLLRIDHDEKRSDEKIIIEYLTTALRETPHVSVHTLHHERLGAIAKAVASVPRFRDIPQLVLAEGTTPERRKALIEAHGRNERGLLFATTGQVSTGIDNLTYVKQWLLAEPTTTVQEVLQLAGRFSRLKEGGQGAPALGKILIREGRDDTTMRAFRERLETANALVRGNVETRALLQKVSQKSPQKLSRILDRIAAGFQGNNVDSEDEDLEGED